LSLTCCIQKTRNLGTVVVYEKWGCISMNMGERMHTEELRVTNGNVESARSRIYTLFTQCLHDIEKTASAAGLTMRDVGIDVEKYAASGDSCIVELKLQL
jgi:hypothetical protein